MAHFPGKKKLGNVAVFSNQAEQDVCLIVAKIGEDASLVAKAHALEHPSYVERVVVFDQDYRPRRDLCSKHSVAAAVPAARLLIERTLATDPRSAAELEAAWKGICEHFSTSYGKPIL